MRCQQSFSGCHFLSFLDIELFILQSLLLRGVKEEIFCRLDSVYIYLNKKKERKEVSSAKEKKTCNLRASFIIET